MAQPPVPGVVVNATAKPWALLAVMVDSATVDSHAIEEACLALAKTRHVGATMPALANDGSSLPPVLVVEIIGLSQKVAQFCLYHMEAIYALCLVHHHIQVPLFSFNVDVPP